MKQQLNILLYLTEIQADIMSIAENALLRNEESFEARLDAIDFIDFHIIGRLESILSEGTSEELLLLKDRAEGLKLLLESIDTSLFQKLRADIRAGYYIQQGFVELVERYVKSPSLGNVESDDIGYDSLDVFINGLLTPNTIPEPAKELENEMVFYQKTPARVVFEITEQVAFTETDVFIDIGSGLGQVPMLINLLTGIKTQGVEFDPAFCRYANECAAALSLQDIAFINVDAREADYAAGTIFFMYTPFKGELLQQVLVRLKQEALTRKITIITYGPCTPEIAGEDWLSNSGLPANSIYKPVVFTSNLLR